MKIIIKLGLQLFLFLLFQGVSIGQSNENFKVSDTESHSFIIVLSGSKLDFPETRAGITKYFWMNHAADGLKISHILIGEKRSVSAMYVEEFTNKAEAMKFYKKLKQNRPDFLQMGLTKDYFVVSEYNYNQILLNESLNGYMTFFKENYL